MLIRNLHGVIALPMSDGRLETSLVDLELKKATPATLLEIIQEIENNFDDDRIGGDKEFELRMELLFETINQYKFLFPFKSSRLYEVCFFKKLLLRVIEDGMSKDSNDFCFCRLIMIVLDKQKHQVQNKFRQNVIKLLQVLVEDLNMLTEDTQLAFQQSLNLDYLHEIASATGKNHLKAIEQYFQDESPDEAMAGIQTNHFLYSYIEMLHRIWCFACGVQPICTWPAFNSTMQIHHDIIAKLKDWRQKCEKMIDEEMMKLHNIKARDEDSKKIQDFTQILHRFSVNIEIIEMHMQQGVCLKYAGETLKSIQYIVMTLWFRHHNGSKMFSASLFDVYSAYCEVKCYDNNDKMLNFKVRKDLEVTEVSVKTVTQAMLAPSSYLDCYEIDVPELYKEYVDELFTVKTGSNVVLSKDPICQQIINETMTNFGIILRHNSSLDDLEERQKCVKASLGIITNSSGDAYLDHYRQMPFQKHKIQGSWDITLDTESSLEKITTESLDSKHVLNMFFDDDGLDLSGSEKKYLLGKFISSRFFEFCKPLKSGDLTPEESENLFDDFQRHIFLQRYKSCKLFVQIESNDDDFVKIVRIYETLYGTYDGCEQSIAYQIEHGNSSTESQEGTKTKTGDEKSKGFMRAFVDYVGVQFTKLTGQTNPEVSGPPGATFENADDVDIELLKAKGLKDQAKKIATTAKNEPNKDIKSTLERESLAKKEEMDQICTQVLQFLRFKRTQNMFYPSDTNTSFVKKAEELKRADKQMREALDLQGVYGTWLSDAKPSEVRTDLSLMPLTRDSGLGEIDVHTPAQSPSQPAGTVDMPQTVVPGLKAELEAELAAVERGNASLQNTQTPASTTGGSRDATRAQTADVAQSPAARTSPNAQRIPAEQVNGLEQDSETTESAPVRTTDVTQGPVAGNAEGASKDKKTVPVKQGGALEQDSKPAIGEQLLPIAPINQMENEVSVSKFSEFEDKEMNDLLKEFKFQEIFLPKTMKGFDGRKKTIGTENEFKLNIVNYFDLYFNQYAHMYQFLPAHTFVLVNSSIKSRYLASRAFDTLTQKTTEAYMNFKSLCLNQDVTQLKMPEWINEEYLSDVLKLLRMPTKNKSGGELDVQHILNFDSLPMFARGPLAKADVKLKVRYLLYIALAKKGIEELELLGSEKATGKQLTPKPTTQGSGARGLFTLPTAWCDDSANEGPPESARVCCRCGMCTRVEEKTDLLPCRTAPPTHPLLDTYSTHLPLNACSTHPLLNACSTHSGYSVPSRLVFAPAATPGMVLGMVPGMVPGTPAQQVYMLVQNTRF